MNGRIVHVIGAGVAGLSAAVRLVEAGLSVVVHEATRAAGGAADRTTISPSTSS